MTVVAFVVAGVMVGLLVGMALAYVNAVQTIVDLERSNDTLRRQLEAAELHSEVVRVPIVGVLDGKTKIPQDGRQWTS